MASHDVAGRRIAGDAAIIPRSLSRLRLRPTYRVRGPRRRGGGNAGRVALVTPAWNFEGSIYFGCREPHLPLEFGYSRALLEREGHDVLLADGQLHDIDDEDLAETVAAFRPDAVVITTAPSYLFWRCAPPELRVPQHTLRAVRGAMGGGHQA